jgi:Flp pilus assembly protein TadG
MTFYRQKQHLRKRRAGQSLVEFALVVPLLLVLLLGIMEYGWFMRNQLTVSNAAREGARYAVVGRSTSDIISRIQTKAAAVPGAPGKLTITLKRDDNDASNGYNYNINLGNSGTSNDAPTGCMIQVKVSIPNQSLTGFFPFLKNRTISAMVQMRREA